MRRLILALLSLAAAVLPATTAVASEGKPAAGLVRVRLETSEGPIVVAVDMRHAPRTSANFLTYVDDGRFDGTSFYRAARRKSDPRFGLVQGGIDTDARRALPVIPHEPTTLTHIRHLDATLSMARRDKPGTAAGNFFITIGAIPSMDAKGSYAGYAAFGHVVSGMDIVRRILAKPTGGGSGVTRGQMILQPVRLIRALRLDGRASPSGRVKPWLIQLPRRKPAQH